jgi:hypothetical protein
MLIFRPFFESRFRNQLPAIVRTHLSRLAYQWEVRINRTIGDLRDEALMYIRNEIATIGGLLCENTGRTEDIHKISAELEENLMDLETPDIASTAGSI